MESNQTSEQTPQAEEPAVYQPLNQPETESPADDDPNETFLTHVRTSFFDE